jgi:hypothetical protein
VIGITDAHPEFFEQPPSKHQLRDALITAVNRRYHLTSEAAARNVATSLGIRVALYAARSHLLSHFRLEDLEAETGGPGAGR